MARFTDTAGAAAYLGMSVRALRDLRAKGRIPSSNPTGGHVIYDCDELDRWVAAAADPRPDARSAQEAADALKRMARNRRRNADRSRARSASPTSPVVGPASGDLEVAS